MKAGWLSIIVVLFAILHMFASMPGAVVDSGRLCGVDAAQPLFSASASGRAGLRGRESPADCICKVLVIPSRDIHVVQIVGRLNIRRKLGLGNAGPQGMPGGICQEDQVSKQPALVALGLPSQLSLNVVQGAVKSPEPT